MLQTSVSWQILCVTQFVVLSSGFCPSICSISASLTKMFRI